MKIRAIVYFLPMFLMATMAEAQLTGEWTSDNGGCYKIRQIGSQIFWSLDDQPRVINVFTGYIAGNIITGNWADLPGGNLQGSGTLALRVESNDRLVKIDQTGNYLGAVLTRGSCKNQTSTQITSRPDLSGVWYDYSSVSGYSGAISKITQSGDRLVFLNSFNNQSDGNFINNTTVIATGWEGGLKAALEDGGRRIAWTNGSVWQRDLKSNPQATRPDLSGIWYDYSASSGNAGLISRITQSGEKLVFINSYNNQSEGSFINNTTVIASGWEGGLRATLEDSGRRIVWTNSSVWQRSKR